MTKLFHQYKLHEGVPRADQRLLLDFATHHKESATVKQLLDFIPAPEPRHPTQSPQIQTIRANIIGKLVEQRAKLKLPAEAEIMKQSLLDEFHQVDENCNGLLNEQQVKKVFGPEVRHSLVIWIYH